jgi:bis(5'-nucleosyl)-tetraphosphatase (symmetrical)
MAVYAVGDVQGCYDALRRLLERVQFDADRDRLWFVGDVINRGPQSLETLRFVHSLGDAATLVLGNHEVHLLAVAAGVRRTKQGDTLDPILAAADRDVLLRWLEQRPLLHWDPDLGYCMVHAGIPPHWDLAEAVERAEEARGWLTPDRVGALIGPCSEEPLELTTGLEPALRARVIVSYLTRLRVCTAGGRMNLEFKGSAGETPAGFLPWFAHPGRKTQAVRLVFGHWAALQGEANTPNVFALDTGCSWGRSLTLLRLGDEARVSYRCGC